MAGLCAMRCCSSRRCCTNSCGCRKAANAPPARQSARLRGVAADPALAGGVKSETAGGKVELVHAAAADAARKDARRGRLSQGTLPFHCEDAGEGDESGVAFLALLRSHSSASTSGQSLGASGAAFPTKLGRKTVAKLTLDSSDVAKVTRDGTTGIMFHPSSALLLASADKQGNVGFWGVGRKGGHGDSGGGADLFCSIKVHDQYISAITWLQGGEPHVLATSSYDGSVRMLDVNAAAFHLLKGLPEVRVGKRVAQGEGERADGAESAGCQHAASSLVCLGYCGTFAALYFKPWWAPA